MEARNRYLDRRRRRYDLRSTIRKHTHLKRLRACGHWPRSKEGVDIYLREDVDAAYYSGLQSCASPWVCPVCAAKIRQRHAEDIASAALQWIENGKGLYSTLLTLPHRLGMKLERLWDFMRGAFRKLLTGGSWQRTKARYGLEGFVRSTEVTHGENGWHPHIHILLFFDGEPEPDELAELADYIYGRWNAYVEEEGLGTARRSLICIDPVRSASQVCQYLAKTGYFEENPDYAVIDGRTDRSAKRIGLELARSDTKQGRRGGRSPFQIIADYAAEPVENCGDLALWLEWEAVSKGKRSIEWSRDTVYQDDGSRKHPSFKRRFGLEEKEDEELAEEEVGGAMLYHLTPSALSVVRASGRMLRVLEVAESHGRGGVDFYCEYLMTEFAKTGDLSGLEELDAMLEASELVSGEPPG